MKIIKELIPYVFIILFVVLVRTFIITPVRVDGVSMDPTLKDGEILLLKKYDKKLDRFDIVVVNYQGTRIVKRIIGLPGETIRYEENTLYVNNDALEESFLLETVKTSDFDLSKLNYDVIPENYYFVVGDNRNNSTDSRIIGLISIDDILGTTNFALFPFNKFGKVK